MDQLLCCSKCGFYLNIQCCLNKVDINETCEKIKNVHSDSLNVKSYAAEMSVIQAAVSLV